MSVSQALECRWQVDGLELAGLSWGQAGRPAVLALHGWLDNAASFSRLAPLLEEYHVVAPDLSGHGHSSFRSADAGYQIWDDLPQLLAVADQLGWRHFSVIGHSRGAIIATLLAASVPERVQHLVCLDGLVPPPLDEQAFPGQLGRFMEERQRLLNAPAKNWATRDAALSARSRRGLSAQAVELLASRGLQREADGWFWRQDARLRGASAVKLTVGQIQAVLTAISCPSLLLLAQDGLTGWASDNQEVLQQLSDLVVRRLAGSHHFHMESPAGEIAGIIAAFLSQSTEN